MIKIRSYQISQLFFVLLITVATVILTSQLQFSYTDQSIEDDLNEMLSQLNQALIKEWELLSDNDRHVQSNLLKATKVLEFNNDTLAKWKEADLQYYLQHTKKLHTGIIKSANRDNISYSFEVNIKTIDFERFSSFLNLSKSKWNYRIVESSKYAIDNKTDGAKIFLEIESNRISGFLNILKCLLFFIGFLGLTIMSYRVYLISENYKQRFWSSFLFGIGLLGPLLLVYLVQASLVFYTDSVYFLFYGLTSLSVVGFINNYSSTSAVMFTQNNRFVSSLPWVVAIVLSTFGLLYGSDQMVGLELLNINFEGVFYSPIDGIISLAGIMLALVALFLIHYKLYTLFNSIVSNNKVYKWTILAISILVSTILSHLFLPGISPVVMGVCMLIYLLILDMFVDAQSFNISWIILWLFLISSFYTLILFGLKTYHDKKIINEILETAVTDWDTDLVSKLQNLRSSMSLDKIEALATISFPFQMSKADIASYLTNDSIDNQLLDFYCFDKNGSSLIRDEYWNSAGFKSSLRYQKAINDSIAYNPLNGNHFTKYTIHNEEHPGSPFSLYISTFNLKNDFSHIQSLSNLGIQIFGNKGPKLIDSIEANQMKTGMSEIEIADKNYQVYKTEDGSIVYHRQQVFDLIKPISLFSYIFVSLGILLILVSFLDHFIDFLPLAFKYSINQSSLRKRLQVNIVLLIVVSFIIIGIVTVFYFQRVSKDHSISNLKTNLQTLSGNIAIQLSDLESIDQAQRMIQDKLADYATHYQAHLIQYDQFGNMVNATIPGMTNKKVAFDWISNLESDYELYLPKYAKVRDEDFISGSALIQASKIGLVGFIQLIHQEQQSSITNVNDFLGTLLNVYVFLFLIAGALALAVSNSITYPIAVIGDKMRQFKLGKKNEKLEWNKKDELGALIDEYNHMIVKLEESADFIAKTERDFAWREMAKQVAHEIKNPLTPMKLSIQYMQKAIDKHPERAKDLILNVSSTLVEQIDNLTEIANEFSNFAKIPEAKNDKVIINEVVETVHDLFRKRDDMEILLNEPIDEIHVHADKNHLIRILNNLVKNAIQAIPQNRHGRIELFLYIENQNAIIKVSDNGTGIPKEMEDRVFAPNFTTKNSGTGLGLAISANMAESFNGRIYFETKVGAGTDFYIEIPLLRTLKTHGDPNRVTLD